MALTSIVPAKWSSYILGSLYSKSVLLPLANAQIKSDINIGSSFKVNVIPKLSAQNYSGTISDAEAASVAYSFNVDQKKYNSVLIRDEDAQQGIVDENFLITKFTEAEIESLSSAADAFLAGQYANLGAVGSGASPEDATSGVKALIVLRKIRKAMNQASIPSVGRWIVVGPGFEAQLLEGATAILTQNDAVVRTGYLGSLFGFDIFVSNNIASDTSADEVLIAGYNETMALAHNVTTMEVVRSSTAFGNVVRGLYVFGGGSLGHTTSDVRGIACFVDTIA